MELRVLVVGADPKLIDMIVEAAPEGVKTKGSRNFAFAFGSCTEGTYRLTATQQTLRGDPLQFSFNLEIPKGGRRCEVELYSTGGPPRVYCQ